MRVVVDTNCLLASIPPKSQYYWLYEAFAAHQFTWVLSTDVLLEYTEQLALIYSKKAAELVLNILNAAPNVALVSPSYQWNLILNDPDDNKFVDLYIAGQADVLVTQDKDFNILKEIDFPPVRVFSLHDFKTLLRNK
jgi:putative PIN family toxin of toxin-antitoxin system